METTTSISFLEMKREEIHSLLMSTLKGNPTALYKVGKDMRICPQTLKKFMVMGSKFHIGFKTIAKIENWCIREQRSLVMKHMTIEKFIERYAPILERLSKE